ncbi:TPA: DEAD/DEAH box helicase, partial [Desulfurococcaceae archaeon]|nr:DEAD/DEAH box helicase [Desulfurococcaceae archaeon]
MIEAVYQRSCPSCGGDVERERLLAGLPCSKCSEPRGLLAWKEVLEEEYEAFANFFKKAYGFELWGPQRAWAKLALSGSDAVLLAPTGTGKSTFLAALSSFLKRKGKRVLYVVPSKSLEEQVKERLAEEVDVITMRRLVRDPRAYRGYDVYIFDDVDSVMKSPKSATALIIALGLEEAVPIVNEMVDIIKKGLSDEGRRGRYEELKGELERLKDKKGSQVIMASATAGGGSLTAKLILSLLGLSPASAPPAIRYVDDVKMFHEDPVEGAAEVVRYFTSEGLKGIVFVHEGFPIEEVERALRERGVAAEVVKSGKLKALKKLEKGELDAVVAYSSRYGVAARGIDMPDVIRFAVFVRPPFKKFDLERGLNNPLTLLRVMKKLEMKEDTVKLFKMLSKLSEVELALLRRAMEEGGELEGFLGDALSALKEMKGKVLERLKGEKVVDKGFVVKDGKVFLLDPKTYLQASGRTSRLTPKGMTHGVSVVVYDDEDLMKAFEESLKDRVEFKEELVTPKGPKPVKAKNVLIVVESPTKAKTFARIMGGGGKVEVGGVAAHLAVHEFGGEALFAFIVATKGHLFDVTLDEVGTYGVELGEPVRVYYAPINRCRRCNLAWASSDPRCPKCGLPAESSSKVVEALRRLATVVDEVYLATDPDEEGEKIAWDVMAMIYPFNSNIKRMKYYEVTLRGLHEALSFLTTVDEGTVRSQIVRRLDDRLVGFAVSERLKAAFGDPNHGLGRVQGPVLKFVVERAKARKASAGYSVTLHLSNGDTLRLFVKTKEEALKLASVEEVKILKVE